MEAEPDVVVKVFESEFEEELENEAIASTFQDMRVCGFDLDSIKFDGVQRVLGAPLSKDGLFTAKYVEKIVKRSL